MIATKSLTTNTNSSTAHRLPNRYSMRSRHSEYGTNIIRIDEPTQCFPLLDKSLRYRSPMFSVDMDNRLHLGIVENYMIRSGTRLPEAIEIEI